MGSLGRLLLALAALALVAVVVLWAELQPPTPLLSSGDPVQLRNVTAIIPGVARWEHSTLLIREGGIERIVLPQGDAPEDDSRYADHYVLPGLIDLHSHMPGATPLQLTPYFALLHLAAGVTTIRDPGDVDGTGVPAAREGIASGRFPGPRIFACGPFIGGDPPRWPNTIHPSGPEEAESVVELLVAAGSDCVKLYEDLTVEEIAGLVDAARRHGLPALGHVPADLAYEQAGVPIVHHFLGVPPPDTLSRDHILLRSLEWQAVDEARLRAVVDATVAQGIVNTPTLVGQKRFLLMEDYESAIQEPSMQLMPRMYRDVVWHPERGLPFYRGLPDDVYELGREALDKKLRLLTLLHRAGAELRIGTDAPLPFVVPGEAVHEEMRLFHEAGISPEEVWAIATWRAARALGEPMLGTIQAGAPADLLVFREDPTRDLAALDTLEAVIAAGRLYSKEAIDEKIEVYRRHFAKRTVDRLSVAAAKLMIPRLVRRDY